MEIFVARQPIFDDTERVVGFDLLHGDGASATQTATDPVAATSRLLSDHVLVEAGSQLTAGRPAWVRFPPAMLLDGTPLLVPAHRLVVEVDARNATAEVMAACAMLSDYGYTIAVGQIGPDPLDDRLLDLADVIRVDFRTTSGDDRQAIVDQVTDGTPLLAGRVETRQDQADALALGFALLQGDFLSEPATASCRTIDRIRLGVLAAMDAIAADPMDFAEVQREIERDVALSDRLLRYINSATFARRDPITSVHQALVAMGERDVRRWVTVSGLVAVGQSSSRQLLVSALFRAHMCERLAGLLGASWHFELFLTGMYSRLPLVIGADLETTLDQAPLPRVVRTALLDHHGLLWDALQLVSAWEYGDWDGVALGCAHLGLRPDELSDCYIRAITFADAVAEEPAASGASAAVER